jgi:ankyrin repeat protein
MGNSKSKLTEELFNVVYTGKFDVKSLDEKIQELNKECDGKMKLSELKHEQHQTNLLHAAATSEFLAPHTAGELQLALNNKLEFIKKYVSEFDVNEQCPLTKKTALMYACQRFPDQDPNFVRNNSVLDPRITELYCVRETLSGDMVQELLVEGADPELQDIDGNTAIIIAAADGFHAAVKELCGHGVRVDVANNSGATALMKAVIVATQKYQLELASLEAIMARCSAEDREKRDANNKTALFYATEGLNYPFMIGIVEFLIKNRCDFVKDRALLNKSCVDQGKFKMAEYFPAGTNFFNDTRNGISLEYVGKTGNGLIDAALLQSDELFKLFAEQGYSFSTPFPQLPKSAAALHIIASYDLEAPGCDHLACNMIEAALNNKNGETVTLDWDVKDSEGRTPLDYCLAVNTDGLRDLVLTKTNDKKLKPQGSFDKKGDDDENNNEKKGQQQQQQDLGIEGKKILYLKHSATMMIAFCSAAQQHNNKTPSLNLFNSHVMIGDVPHHKEVGKDHRHPVAIIDRFAPESFFAAIKYLKLSFLRAFCLDDAEEDSTSKTNPFRRCNNLETLDLTSIDFAHKSVFAKLFKKANDGHTSAAVDFPKLKSLRIASCVHVTSGWEFLGVDRLPSLETLEVVSSQVGDGKFVNAGIAKCTSLTHLVLRDVGGDYNSQGFDDLMKALTELEYLDISTINASRFKFEALKGILECASKKLKVVAASHDWYKNVNNSKEEIHRYARESDNPENENADDDDDEMRLRFKVRPEIVFFFCEKVKKKKVITK